MCFRLGNPLGEHTALLKPPDCITGRALCDPWAVKPPFATVWLRATTKQNDAVHV